MPADRFQTQRFELKYLVSETTARGIRDFVRSHLAPDDFAATQPDHAYPVHSLYLDSPDLATYQAVQSGEKNRFKIRIRYYAADDEGVYFEIKRRTNDVISKLRAKVRRGAVQVLLDGAPPSRQHLVKPDGNQLPALREFCRLMHHLRATPRSHVGYRREAWMSRRNNSIRVTFDRQVRCEPEFSCALRTSFGAAVTPFAGKVIMEIKFVDRLPNWCGEMIRTFELVRGGAPKYAQGVNVMGENRVSNRNLGLRPPATARLVSAIPQLAATGVALVKA